MQGGGWREGESGKIGQRGDRAPPCVSGEVTEVFKQEENTVLWILGREPEAIWTTGGRERRLLHSTDPPRLQRSLHEFVRERKEGSEARKETPGIFKGEDQFCGQINAREEGEEGLWKAPRFSAWWG